MVFKNLFVLVLWTKVASAFEGLSINGLNIYKLYLLSRTAEQPPIANISDGSVVGRIFGGEM